MNYGDFFETATGNRPYPYQGALSEGPSLPSLLEIPTGLGKTAAVTIAWLWRRLGPNSSKYLNSPRRLIYCLPMRTLVEQTADSARHWVQELRAANCLPAEVPVHILMGGEQEDDWDLYPESEAIIVGTQDMLLSRALNRGYAASRSRWPIQFALLNNDCLWILDEVQLMGSGLATTCQLQGLREKISRTGCQSIWMSATLQPEWLNTADFCSDTLIRAGLEDKRDLSNARLAKRWSAYKPISKCEEAKIGESAESAELILARHISGSRTLVVVNTVRRAQELYTALLSGCEEGEVQLLLIHSRFRARDREHRLQKLLDAPSKAGTIAVCTQVIEAGVDISASTLFTELAPWPSLVQRFGRCNRAGNENNARVIWIDLPDQDTEKYGLPYDHAELQRTRELLKKCEEVGPEALFNIREQYSAEFDTLMRFEHPYVLRRRDLMDLFDTSPDLSGNDIDIDRFIRDAEDTDVRLFWRAFVDDPNGSVEEPSAEARGAEARPLREELCSVPIAEAKAFLKKLKGHAWRWNFLEGRWSKATRDIVMPGQVLLVHADEGGYSSEVGWKPDWKKSVAIQSQEDAGEPDSTAHDMAAITDDWKTIAKHTDEVCFELEAITASLSLRDEETTALATAARWHDLGKAHQAFLAKFDSTALKTNSAQRCLTDNHYPAKAPAQAWVRGKNHHEQYRRYFRHELASALVVLQKPHATLNGLNEETLDLVAYLVASHHGKVRMSIRSLPGEKTPAHSSLLHAQGVWDGDELPEVQLGDSIVAPRVTLSLEYMQTGRTANGRPSWSERVLRLRDNEHLGPFRLAYLETLLRAADRRASRNSDKVVAEEHHRE